MEKYLQNPVYYALLTGNKDFACGNEIVKYFPSEVSPYVGFFESYETGFSDLADMFPAGRKILFAKPETIIIPDGWKLNHEVEGMQMVFDGTFTPGGNFEHLIPLNGNHVDDMLALAKLTKPGPFAKRTIEFGSYHGIFAGDKLVAMAGRRLHTGNYIEISAVCTHPEHTGKGYALSLMQHQMQLILNEGNIPFLHVRKNNERAVSLYEHLGFKSTRPMMFYFLERG